MSSAGNLEIKSDHAIVPGKVVSMVASWLRGREFNSSYCQLFCRTNSAYLISSFWSEEPLFSGYSFALWVRSGRKKLTYTQIEIRLTLASCQWQTVRSKNISLVSENVWSQLDREKATGVLLESFIGFNKQSRVRTLAVQNWCKHLIFYAEFNGKQLPDTVKIQTNDHLTHSGSSDIDQRSYFLLVVKLPLSPWLSTKSDLKWLLTSKPDCP